MTILDESEEKLLKYPVETSKFFLIGYLLRIIPVINIVGFLLTAIAWFKVNKWSNRTGYVLAFIATLGLVAVSVYNVLAVTGNPLTYSSEIQQNTSLTLAEYKKQMIEQIDMLKEQMKNPINYMPPIIMGLLLIIEAYGFINIGKDTNKIIPSYLAIFFIILGILNIAEGAVQPIIADGLDRVKDSILASTDTMQMIWIFIGALTPLLIIAVLVFIVMLITYILAAIKCWGIKSRIQRLRLMTSETEPSRGSEEEILI